MTETSYAAGVAFPRAESRPWLRWVGTIAGVLLGIVLIYSAWGKALDPHGIGAFFARKGLLPAGLAGPAIMLTVAVEAALGLALLVNLRCRAVLLPATLLMAAFFGLTSWEYFFPSAEGDSCGCFGNLILRSPGQAAVQDGLFVVAALLAWLGRPPRAAAARWAAPALGFSAGIALALAAPHLDLDDIATRLAPGVKMADLRLDEVVPETQRGTTLVVIIDRGDQEFRSAVPRLNELILQGAPVGVFALAEPNPELAQSFTWEAGPAFEVREVPFTALKPLYRTLPRSFVVVDGVVKNTWAGLPDDAALAALAAGRTP